MGRRSRMRPRRRTALNWRRRRTRRDALPSIQKKSPRFVVPFWLLSGVELVPQMFWEDWCCQVCTMELTPVTLCVPKTLNASLDAIVPHVRLPCVARLSPLRRSTTFQCPSRNVSRPPGESWSKDRQSLPLCLSSGWFRWFPRGRP